MKPISPEMDQARRAVLDKALGDIIKRYGEGSIMRMGDAKHLEVEACTNWLSLARYCFGGWWNSSWADL